MRLSLGQQMQLAQKQVLAPRMIQSMEILQLPLMALQERIEQEMEDNPVLDQVEVDADEPEDAAEDGSRQQRSPIPSASWSSKTTATTRTISSGYSTWPRICRTTTRSVAGRRSIGSRPKAIGATTRWPTCWPGPSRCVDYLHHQLSWFEMDDAVRRMAERIIYSLDTNGYLKTPLEELLPPLAAELNGDVQSHRAKQLAIAEEALRVVQRLDPPGVGARTLKECLLLQLMPGMPDLRRAADADRQSSGRLGKQSPAADLEEDRHVDREDSGSAGRSCASSSRSRAPISTSRRCPSVTPDVFVERNDDGKYQVRLEDSAAAGALHQPVLPQAVAATRARTPKPASTSSGRSTRPSG